MLGLENDYPYFSIDSEEVGNDAIVSRGYFWRLSSFHVRANSPNMVTRIVTYYKVKPTSAKIFNAQKEIKRIKSSYGKWYFQDVSQYQINALLQTRPKELLYTEQNEQSRLWRLQKSMRKK